MASNPNTRLSTGPAPVGQNARFAPHPQLRKRPSRQSLPGASTALPSFTCGRVFPSEQKLLSSINWNAVASRPLFDDPPTFQTLRIFLFSPRSSPFLSPALKKAINTDAHISHLQRCWDILKSGQKEELQNDFGMPEKVGEMRYEIYRLWIMVKLAWRIVQALKNAVDRSRISEVGEYALYVVDMNKKVAPKKFDPLPLLTLACSLTYPHCSVSSVSKTQDTSTPAARSERDNWALKYFEEGFKSPNNRIRDLPSNVYAKAHFSRLLRRLECEKEADDVEEEIKRWWAATGSTRMNWERLSSLVCAAGEPQEENTILKRLESVPIAPPDMPPARQSGGDGGSRRHSPNGHLSPYVNGGPRPNLTPPEKDPRRGRFAAEQTARSASPAFDNRYQRSTTPDLRAPSPMGHRGMRAPFPDPRAPSPMGRRGGADHHVRSASPNPRAPSPMGFRGMRSPSPNPRAPSPAGVRGPGLPSPTPRAPSPVNHRAHRSPSPVGVRTNVVVSSTTLIESSSPVENRLPEQSSIMSRPKPTSSRLHKSQPGAGGPRSPPLDKPLPVAPSMSSGSSRPPVIPMPLALRNASESSQNDSVSAGSSSPTESRSTTRSTPNTSPSSSTCADDHPPAHTSGSESKWGRKFWKKSGDN